MRITIAVFNHLINQHPALRAELAHRAGRRVAVRLPPLAVEGVITDEGWLAACEGEPEATVRLKPGAALSTLTGREPALSDVLLEGDAELAGHVARVIARMKWDAAEDASRLVGDAAAHRLEGVVKSALGLKGAVGWRLAENWFEHLREEAPLLAKKHDVNRFVAAVDTLRDDVERCDKRLARLEAALSPSRDARDEQGG
ncbi:ubiquinone biosynthesis protein UbiJ [Crenobacter luteus]|uniref:Ubiquinone biosynthesis accessory factor UbiJ n=1 Tax=Crenobacter luteus TaxID=1452487 RepID=A0A165F226_9NEIS|nr:sterol-binding protein [Crenobacter luteus]KZE30051.1 sterol-binding protein [Crenobacter luteus]TCP11023.1 ubiquinone biosynthesis protein UbiJ [Crenobacter luteus]